MIILKISWDKTSTKAYTID